jgi:hypothetical protein
MRSHTPTRRALGACFAILSALIGALISSGCVGGPPAPTGEPAWVAMPPSWERLDEIERWLQRDGASADPVQRLEAELQLAEGRLDYAQLDRSKNPRASVGQRLAMASEGFRRVQSSSAANSSQKNRARSGLDRVERFADEPVAVAVSDPKTFKGLPIIARSAWRPAPEDTSDMDRASGRWNTLTVHHTAMDGVPEPGPGATEAESAEHLRLLQRAHMNSNKWADIGYQFLVDPEGRIFEGRRMTWVGAHSGRHASTGQNFNVDNIGISLMGNFDARPPTAKALAALERTLDHFRREYGIPMARVRGHREWNATQCPGDRLMAWVEDYRGFATAPPASSTKPSRSSSRPKSGAKGKVASLYGFPTSDDTAGTVEPLGSSVELPQDEASH